MIYLLLSVRTRTWDLTSTQWWLAKQLICMKPEIKWLKSTYDKMPLSKLYINTCIFTLQVICIGRQIYIRVTLYIKKNSIKICSQRANETMEIRPFMLIKFFVWFLWLIPFTLPQGLFYSMPFCFGTLLVDKPDTKHHAS